MRRVENWKSCRMNFVNRVSSYKSGLCECDHAGCRGLSNFITLLGDLQEQSKAPTERLKSKKWSLWNLSSDVLIPLLTWISIFSSKRAKKFQSDGWQESSQKQGWEFCFKNWEWVWRNNTGEMLKGIQALELVTVDTMQRTKVIFRVNGDS